MARYLTDLADACRKSGLPVVECAGWKTRGHAAFTSVSTIMCHHTAGPRNGEAPSLNVVTNGRPGLAGPLSQIVLGRSGTVYVVAAGVAWHAGNTRTAAEGNYRAIGIEAEATGVDAWPAVQYDAYVRLCRALIDHYGLSPANVVGHKEAAVPAGRKIDPNFDMNAFRAAVGRVGGASAPGPAPAPKKKRLPTMIDRPIPAGRSEGRIIAPTGAASGIVNRAWISFTFEKGGRVEFWAQKHTVTDGPAVGAGLAGDITLKAGERIHRQLPSGTEYVAYRINANGPGAILIEQEAK